MRLFGRWFVVASLAFACVSIVVGQPPGGQPPGGKGQGKGGKGKGAPPSDYMTLLKTASVKDELKLTDSQIERLPAALQKALAEVLSEKQLTRLREIYVQQRGGAALLEPDIKNEIKITLDQAEKIRAVLDIQTKEQAILFQAGGFDADKSQQLQEYTMGKIEAVLTPEQKAAWTTMVGKPFELQGGGFGGGKGKKKG
jgi:hypothetical protein